MRQRKLEAATEAAESRAARSVLRNIIGVSLLLAAIGTSAAGCVFIPVGGWDDGHPHHHRYEGAYRGEHRGWG